MLDLVNTYEGFVNLRKNAMRSHVQIKHGLIETLEIPALKNVLSQLEKNKKDHWNNELLNMVKGYFKDIDILFEQLSKKMIVGGKVYFNVANSAYYGVHIEVDKIVASIAQYHGFLIEEIRQARNLKPSIQQKNLISTLRESVIVMIR